jgi:SAM-dependent methyltransferase
MVHALREIRRVLVPNGILLDLRPLLDNWQVDVASSREVRETGRVQDYPIGLADDEAANKAIAEAEQNGWFQRERETFFTLFYSWDSASEIEEWIHDEWEGFIDLDEETKRATRSAWALGDADSRARVRMKMLLTRWKVVK